MGSRASNCTVLWRCSARNTNTLLLVLCQAASNCWQATTRFCALVSVSKIIEEILDSVLVALHESV